MKNNTKSFPDGKTHWKDCWRVHHKCAISEIERLHAKIDDALAITHAPGYDNDCGPADIVEEMQTVYDNAETWISEAHEVGEILEEIAQESSISFEDLCAPLRYVEVQMPKESYVKMKAWLSDRGKPHKYNTKE